MSNHLLPDPQDPPHIAYRKGVIVGGCFEYRIPAHMMEGVMAYVIDGKPSGGFLMAMLSGDYMHAAGAADQANRYAFHGWFGFLYNCLPSGAYGSPESVASWMKIRGLRGAADCVV